MPKIMKLDDLVSQIKEGSIVVLGQKRAEAAFDEYFENYNPKETGRSRIEFEEGFCLFVSGILCCEDPDSNFNKVRKHT